MRTLIKTIFICILAFAAKTTALSQSRFPGGQPGYETPNPNSFIDVPTPQAASLGKYGDVPVSYFGSLDIPSDTVANSSFTCCGGLRPPLHPAINNLTILSLFAAEAGDLRHE